MQLFLWLMLEEPLLNNLFSAIIKLILRKPLKVLSGFLVVGACGWRLMPWEIFRDAIMLFRRY